MLAFIYYIKDIPILLYFLKYKKSIEFFNMGRPFFPLIQGRAKKIRTIS